jgi:hypothetical protein
VSLLRNRWDFSLVGGGPFFRLLRRTHLSDDSLALVRRRIVAIALFAWSPLLVLSALEGQLIGGAATVSFLEDVEVHVKLLVVVPLLLFAELVVHRRVRPLLEQFSRRNLIPEDATPRFEAAIAASLRLRNAVLPELLLIALVYGVGIEIIWRHYTALPASTWYATPAAGGSKLSLAGVWYGYVSLPLTQFLLLRWYFRLFIWTRFLWKVSRIRLRLVPTHPDRVGGLSFLSQAAGALTVLAVAHGAILSARLAGRILFVGASLLEFKAEIAALVVVLSCVILGPLLVFAPQLAAAKRKGLRDYGMLAERYVREFDTRWLHGAAPAGEPLLGSADIQSLADMSNSYDVVRTMRAAPITKQAVLGLVVATLLPIAPLLLTVMPLEALLKKLASLLF